ncbi:MAG: type IV secretion system protein [Caulobacteraceae bacterium]|nr:type IV secretion system protein [Caulobacteraceae bacterium]
MASACPAPAVDAPLVRGLLDVTDCHVRELVHTGYGALFQGSDGLAGVLTALMTLYVALIGYQLMLGRMDLRIGDVTLTAVKLGGVLVFATQWDSYQALVFGFLFDGPAQIATQMLHSIGPDGSGDVFDGLQRAFDALSGASSAYAQHSPLQASPLLGGAGFAALALNGSASLLLLSSLGVILASKIVLGVLLATGPIFLALLLFETTKGLFEGWLRAALAFAFAPLAVTFLLAVILAILEPSLAQLAELRDKPAPALGPAYSIFTLVLVFTAVSAGLVAASGVIFGGFKLPARTQARPREPLNTAPPPAQIVTEPSRAARIASAVASQGRRAPSLVIDRGSDPGPAPTFGAGVGAQSSASRGQPHGHIDTPRLGQPPRRRANPRTLSRPLPRRPQ